MKIKTKTTKKQKIASGDSNRFELEENLYDYLTIGLTDIEGVFIGRNKGKHKGTVGPLWEYFEWIEPIIFKVLINKYGYHDLIREASSFRDIFTKKSMRQMMMNRVNALLTLFAKERIMEHNQAFVSFKPSRVNIKAGDKDYSFGSRVHYGFTRKPALLRLCLDKKQNKTDEQHLHIIRLLSTMKADNRKAVTVHPSTLAWAMAHPQEALGLSNADDFTAIDMAEGLLDLLPNSGIESLRDKYLEDIG